MENDPKKILLIDDSALMRRVMSDIINHIDGFTVAYLAADGEEGYAYLSKQNDIDVVMTDIDMPKMDGLTLIKKSKEAAAIFTMLLPMRMEERSLSYFSAIARTRAAEVSPSSARLFRRIWFREENAVSEAEKNAENAIRITSATKSVILPSSIIKDNQLYFLIIIC